ncbi:MAG TPA: hypothetical protein VFZ00_09190 [Solirubrobacter sp.]|jgi:hypothetical protein|nr:hypothetical protein [Solirubrobacter sp.]
MDGRDERLPELTDADREGIVDETPAEPEPAEEPETGIKPGTGIGWWW